MRVGNFAILCRVSLRHSSIPGSLVVAFVVCLRKQCNNCGKTHVHALIMSVNICECVCARCMADVVAVMQRVEFRKLRGFCTRTRTQKPELFETFSVDYLGPVHSSSRSLTPCNYATISSSAKRTRPHTHTHIQAQALFSNSNYFVIREHTISHKFANRSKFDLFVARTRKCSPTAMPQPASPAAARSNASAVLVVVWWSC